MQVFEMYERLKVFTQKAWGVPFLDRGRDFNGWDCAGMIIVAYRFCAEIEIPDVDGISAFSGSEVGRLVKEMFLEVTEEFRSLWRPVERRKEQRFDLVLLRLGRWPVHLGLVVAPGFILHAEPDTGTCIEPFYRGMLAPRFVGLYRHERFANDTGK